MMPISGFILSVLVAFVVLFYLNDTHKGLEVYEASFGFHALRSGAFLFALTGVTSFGFRLYERPIPGAITGHMFLLSGGLAFLGLWLTHRRYVNGHEQKGD